MSRHDQRLNNFVKTCADGFRANIVRNAKETMSNLLIGAKVAVLERYQYHFISADPVSFGINDETRTLMLKGLGEAMKKRLKYWFLHDYFIEASQYKEELTYLFGRSLKSVIKEHIPLFERRLLPHSIFKNYDPPKCLVSPISLRETAKLGWKYNESSQNESECCGICLSRLVNSQTLVLPTGMEIHRRCLMMSV